MHAERSTDAARDESSMRLRRARGPRTRYRCNGLLCSVLIVYATWPDARAIAASAPHALRLSPQIAHAVDTYTHSGEPLALALSYELGAGAGTPARASEPLALRLAIVLRARPGVLTPELDAHDVVDVATAQPVFYAIRVNRQDFGVARLLRLADGRWLARRADLEEWRLRIPEAKPVLFGGEEHYLLDAFEGVAYTFNEPLQALDLSLAPKYFASTLVHATPARSAAPATPPPGGFLNYDLSLTATSDSRRLDGLFEGAFFNRHGVGTSGFVARDVGSERDFVRLETAWRRDFVSGMKSLIIGDAIGSSGTWGRPVRFGGLSYGTNFSTNPGFVTFPLPTLAGEAALPTTTELYVDGVLRQSSRVPPGPFRIDNVPVVTGRGEVRLVVRDLLGREQVLSVPYYASTQLLREGLIEESYEIGAVRNNFGIRSHDYGRAVAAIQRRKGFTDRLTGEVRAEVLRHQQTAGAGASFAVPALGAFTGAAALSRSAAGAGGLLSAAFERQVWQGVSFGVRSQWASSAFTQLGLQPGQRAPARLASGNVGYAPAGLGSFGAAYVRQDYRDQPGVEILSGSYSVNIAKSMALIVFAFKPLHGGGTHSVGMTLAVGFDERRSGSLNVTAQPGANQAVVQFQQNLPAGTGTGYRFLAGGGEQGGRQEAGFAFQGETGTYIVEAGRADGRTAIRANASGAVAALGGRPYLSRTLDQSFGVAHVEGFANVGVYVNNQIVARTDQAGYALLPRLLPYQTNPVRIDTGDLPLDTRIDATQIEAVPYFRSGLLLEFPVQRANSALLVLTLADGTAMPVGSVVNIVGRTEKFPVAQRGEVYVTGLSQKSRLRATWRDQSCEFEVEPGTALGLQPRIGPITCAGVSP